MEDAKPVVRKRRASSEDKLRRLLDATEEIMCKEGYAAVSSRSVANAAGIQAPLLHYYFPTIDELFVAVLRRRAGRSVERMAAALASHEPLRAWWRLAADPHGAGLFIELLAAANHRVILRAEVGAIAREIRRVQVEALSTLLPEYGLDPEVFTPVLIAATLQGVAFGVMQDLNAGYDTAPRDAVAAAEALIDRLERTRAASKRSG